MPGFVVAEFFCLIGFGFFFVVVVFHMEAMFLSSFGLHLYFISAGLSQSVTVSCDSVYLIITCTSSYCVIPATYSVKQNKQSPIKSLVLALSSQQYIFPCSICGRAWLGPQFLVPCYLCLLHSKAKYRQVKQWRLTWDLQVVCTKVQAWHQHPNAIMVYTVWCILHSLHR